MVYCLASPRLKAAFGFSNLVLDSMTADDEAMSQIRRLDPIALGALHDRHFPELFRYARYRLGDSAVAEDTVSETFVRLLEAAQAGRVPRSSLRGWLFGTLRHVVDDHFRAAYRRPQEDLGHAKLVDDLVPDGLVEAEELRQEVRRALRRLTGEQQHVLALRFGGGYSLEETAALMGRNSNAIKALQFRALQTLRRTLGAEAS